MAQSYIKRTAVSDIDLNTGRYITANAVSLSATAVQVSFLASKVLGRHGVLARYTDTNNWLFFGAGGGVDPDQGGGARGMAVIKRVAGTVTTIRAAQSAYAGVYAGVPYTFRLVVYADGNYSAAVSIRSGQFANVYSGYDASLGTGGAINSGRVGIYDAQVSSTASLRAYADFAAWVPPDDAVTFASRATELASDGMRRQDAGGIAFGPVPWSEGDLPRLPASGLENRPAEIIVKSSRGDLGNLADTAIDDTSVRVAYRPCYLHVPET